MQFISVFSCTILYDNISQVFIFRNLLNQQSDLSFDKIFKCVEYKILKLLSVCDFIIRKILEKTICI